MTFTKPDILTSQILHFKCGKKYFKSLAVTSLDKYLIFHKYIVTRYHMYLVFWQFTTGFVLKYIDKYVHCTVKTKCNALSFCRSQNILFCLSQTKNLIAFSAAHKKFVPAQKLNGNHLLIWHKKIGTGTIKIYSELGQCIYFFTSTKSNTFPPKNSN